MGDNFRSSGMMDSYEPVKTVLVDTAPRPFTSGGNGWRGHPCIWGGGKQPVLLCGDEYEQAHVMSVENRDTAAKL